MQTKQIEVKSQVSCKCGQCPEDHFHVEVQMYSIWDGVTEDGYDRQCWKQFITLPEDGKEHPFVSKEVFNKFMSKKDRRSVQRRNFWRMMRYWNRKAQFKVIDQKQFLLDTKILIEDSYTYNTVIYKVDKEMLKYVNQYREEIEQYFPKLLYIIDNVEENVLQYNTW